MQKDDISISDIKELCYNKPSCDNCPFQITDSPFSCYFEFAPGDWNIEVIKYNLNKEVEKGGD